MTRVLVVSEDPFFIHEARAVLGCVGGEVLGCTGPARADCYLYQEGSCPLASLSDVVLVDSPSSGEFSYHSTGIAAGDYAEALQASSDGVHVLLAGPPPGSSGGTGRVPIAPDRRSALFVLTRLLRDRNKPPGGRKG